VATYFVRIPFVTLLVFFVFSGDVWYVIVLVKTLYLVLFVTATLEIGTGTIRLVRKLPWLALGNSFKPLVINVVSHMMMHVTHVMLHQFVSAVRNWIW
jgi:hypothetical protein